MSSLDLTRDWLRNVLKPYPSRERILPEIMEILAKRRTLSVKTEAFTFDNGQAALLVLLHGTLPINFKGATYHIPVNIWIPHEYPRMPPLAFVVPTKDMGVRKGREVEPSGRVTEDVIQTWWNGWQAKTIEMLLAQLTSVFSATPPVYAKPPEPSAGLSSRPTQNGAGSSPRATTMPASSLNTSATPPPAPARPFSGSSFAAVESLPLYQSEQTPPPHPFPHQQVIQPHSGPSRQMSSPPIPHRPHPIPSHAGSFGPGSPGGPVLPQRPYIPQPQPRGGPPIAGPSYNDPRYSQSPPPGSGWRNSPSPYPQYPPQNQQPATGQYPQQLPPHINGQYSHQRQGSDPYSHQPSQPQAGQQVPPPVQSGSPLPQTQPAPPSAARRPMQDLLSSPEQTTSDLPSETRAPGAPPPIPPSKPPPPSLLHLHSILLPHINASLPPLIHSLESSRQQLRERNEDLTSGEPAIRDEMARLEAVKKVCDSVGRKLGDAVAQGQERVAELEARGEVSVDEVVCGISIVHNQLIDLVAEDNAIEDTIYHMTRALDNERIDLDRYMKSIRTLAREQYTKRALIERILQGMGQTQGW